MVYSSVSKAGLLILFIPLRCRFASRRLISDLYDGLVFMRGFNGSAAFLTISASRFTASFRFLL
jgi:hypothetical protein